MRSMLYRVIMFKTNPVYSFVTFVINLTIIILTYNHIIVNMKSYAYCNPTHYYTIKNKNIIDKS